MTASPFFRLLAVTLVVLQLVGPGLIWAMDQRGVEVRPAARVVVSGLSGGELTATSPEGTKTVQFNEAVGFGDQLQTQSSATAEVLINNQAVVTMLGDSDASLTEVNGDTVVHLSKGSVLVSAAASALGESRSVIIETPSAQIRTRGGRLKATVGTAPGQARIIQPSMEARAYLTSLSVRPVASEPALSERFEVYEGTVQVGARTAGATPLLVEPGQSIQAVGGTLGTPTGIERAATGNGPVLLASAQHAGTPQTGLELVSQRQMQQVGALQQALFGDSDAAVEGKESQSGTIISTLFGTNPTQTSSSSNPNNPTASLFGSGSPYLAALLAAINRSGSGVGNDNSANNSLLTSAGSFSLSVDGGHGLLTLTDLPGDAGQETKKSVFTGSELLLVDSGPLAQASHSGRAPISTLVGRGLTDKFQFEIPSFSPGNPLTTATMDLSASRLRIVDTRALTFQGYEVTLLSVASTPLTSSGFFNEVGTFELRNISTNAVVRTERQVFGNFQLDPGPRQITRLSGTIPFDGLNIDFALEAPAGQTLTFGQRFLVSPISNRPLARVDGNTGIPITVPTTVRDTQDQLDRNLNVLILPVSEDKRVIADRILDTESSTTFRPGVTQNRDVILSDFSSRPDGEACSFCDGGGPGTTTIDRNKPSFVDAIVSARSSSAEAAVVNLAAGVVLTNATEFTVANQIVRRDFFRDPGQERSFSEIVRPLPPVPSATSLYYKELGLTPSFEGSVTAIVASGNEPAFVRVQDRVLAVLNGSSIKPDVVNGQEIRTSLLSVLDSQLIGPTETPRSINSEGVLKSHRESSEIPPLLEIVDSSVKSASAVVVRATESGIGRFALDRALLDASSPILTVTNSNLTATGHLIDLAGTGPNGKELLRANLVPNDALVRLNGKTMDVAGNFLNLAKGSATVNGYLFSLANAGTLNIGGTLLSLTGNSILRLNSDAFGIFDQTANTLRLSNTLCAGGECGLLTDHLNAPFQSSNGKAIQVAGSKTNVQLPQGFTPFRAPSGTTSTVVLDEHAALLHIEPGSELHISVPVVKK